MYKLTLKDVMEEVGIKNSPDFFAHIKVKNKPMAHQLEMARKYASSKRWGDWGEPGCVSGDTEFLTPDGWKRIDEYEEGDKVAQFDPNYLTMSFTYPLRYIKEKCEWFYKVKPTKGLSMVLSPCHRVLSFVSGSDSDRPKYRTDSMEEVAQIHAQQQLGFRDKICVTPEYDGQETTGLSSEELRVMVMVVADGSYPNSTNRVHIKVKKERKKVRCRQLLDAANIEYTEWPDSAEEYSVYSFVAPLRTKVFPKEWWHLGNKEKEAILDEVRHWDSSETHKQKSFRFTTSLETEADFVQFVAASMGHPTSKRYRRHEIGGHELDEYTIYVQGKKLKIGIKKGQEKECQTITKIPSEDGFMYCFTVPSSFLVLRHEGYIFTTGNCGKTLPAHLHGILMASLGNKVVYTMPPKLIEQFEEEMLEWFIGIGHHLKIQRMNHPAAKKRELVEEFEKSGWPDILLMSYDGYREFNDVNKTKKIGSNQWYHDDGSRWTAESGRAPYTKDGRKVSKSGKAENDKHLLLNKRGYNVFFFDEAHALCGLDSIISRSVEETAKGDTAIYLMTGTPVPTTITDSYGLIRLINPEAYVSQSAFERKHIVYRNQMIPHPRFPGRTMTIKVPEKYVGTEEIMEHLYAKATRVQKRDIHDMPEPIITDVKVKLSGPHAKLYKDVINNQFAIMGDVILAPEHSSQVRHMALQLISCPTVFNPEVPMKNELFLRTQELLDSIDPFQNKVIVFAYYKAAIEFLQQEFAQYNPAVLYGETVNGHAEVTKFKTDDSCRMIILNWLSGGAGLNLQVASHIVFYECPTSPKDAKQAIARSDRTGQQNLVNVYFMRVLGTLSDRNFKKLLTAGEDVNRVVNDRHDLLHEVLKK